MSRITALKFGESTIAESQVYQYGDPNKRVPIAFTMYLICTGERRILVDAGCYTMPDFEMQHFCGPAAVLRSVGVQSEEITDVILTHTHHDHIEAIGDYPNAAVYLHRSEYETARPYLGDRNVVLFDDSYTLVNGVTVRHVGGHSVGSSIVTVGDFVIVGDECYARDCLTEGRPIGSVYDREASRRFLEAYADAKALLCHENILPGQSGFEHVN